LIFALGTATALAFDTNLHFLLSSRPLHTKGHPRLPFTFDPSHLSFLSTKHRTILFLSIGRHSLAAAMGSISKTEPLDGLGNHVYLEKQDKLRDIGVDIPTSQV